MSNKFSLTRIENDEFNQHEQTADAEGFLSVPDESNAPTISDQDGIGLLGSIGRYRLIKKVGSGGSSVVYLAQDSCDRSNRFAIKLFKRSIRDPGSRVRFNRETNALKLLNHPNIAKLIDDGVTVSGHPYIVFEFIDGDRIDVYCRKRDASFHHRIELIAASCSALQHAHDQGIVHRDLKPGNIVVSHTGKAYLTDFGLSKLFEGQTPDDERTRTGAILGTLNFLAPEQLFSTKDASSFRTDIFGLGAVLHVLLTRKPPLQFDNVVDAATSYFKRLPTRLDSEGIPRDLEKICIKCLSANPNDRYPSAKAVEIELQRFLEGKSVSAKRPNFLQKYSLLTRQYPFLSRGIPVLLVTLLVFAIVAAGLLWKSQDDLQQANHSKMQLLNAMQQVTNHVRRLEDSPETFDMRLGLLRLISETLSEQGQNFESSPELLYLSAVVDYRLSDLEYSKGNAIVGKRYRSLARDKSSELLSRDPNHEDAEFLLFQSLLWLGQYDEAFVVIESLLEKHPENDDYKEALCTTCQLIGDEYFSRYKYAEARPYYESAQAVSDSLPASNPDGRFDRKRAIGKIEAARFAILDGDMQRADNLLQDVLEVYRNLNPLLRTTQGESDEYLNCLRFAMSLAAFRGDDESTQAYFARASEFYELAIARFSSYVQIHRTYCRILEDYAAFCFQYGREDKILGCRDVWNRIVEDWEATDRDSVNFYTEKLALLLFPFFPPSDIGQAQDLRNRLILLNPNQTQILIGRVSLVAGDLDQAKQYFERSTILYPSGIENRVYRNAILEIERPGVENADSVVGRETRLSLLAVTQSYASTLLESAVREDLERYSDSTSSRLEAQ